MTMSPTPKDNSAPPFCSLRSPSHTSPSGVSHHTNPLLCSLPNTRPACSREHLTPTATACCLLITLQEKEGQEVSLRGNRIQRWTGEKVGDLGY
eukprot:CAMPEP_0173437394 /NCGR_PEP_ID=MMETSP1357-20121228/18005_1 /TAXON_ID=77926 /ORGANISM="Hemiselmis rufescens, Strain PCC563" /LENGTH=93 /DNA_ID=CAMNT_0014402573 /DNA_START=706 /DNA_END=987 /DNA_ORIENTATION=+